MFDKDLIPNIDDIPEPTTIDPTCAVVSMFVAQVIAPMVEREPVLRDAIIRSMENSIRVSSGEGANKNLQGESGDRFREMCWLVLKDLRRLRDARRGGTQEPREKES